MALSVAIFIIVVASVIGVVAILLLRRVAPDGSFFDNHDRAAGMFGVLGTVFAILIGFIILFAFDSHSTARNAASTEASTVLDAFETAELFGPPGQDLQADLICYSRAVIHDGWKQMQDANPSVIVEDWNRRLDITTNALPTNTNKQDDGFQQLLDARGKRDEARRIRLQEAGHTIPAIIWVAVILACLAPFAFAVFFADPKEKWWIQALGMGLVTALTVAAFLAVYSLDDPFSGGEGSIPPGDMRTTLGVIQHAARLDHPNLEIPCTATGIPLRV
jgi:protein-S-isoprenylcysteine O-methyltransferase Ste14